MISYNMVDAKSKESLTMEDLTSEDVVSNVSSFGLGSQDYSSTPQGSEMSRTQAYWVNSRRKSSQQLQESQDAEPIIPDSSNKEARKRKSVVKPVVGGETRARWAMLRSLVGVADAEDEKETDGNSGVQKHEIESDLQSGEAGYQASDYKESRSHRPQVPSITASPSGQLVATEMLTASRNLLADSAKSATNDAASIERYIQNLSKDPRIDLRGLSAGLQDEKIDSVEKDFKALGGFVENVVRADTHDVERIVHIEKETIENAVGQASIQGIERTLHTEGERIKGTAGAFGKIAGKVLEEDAHEIKKALEKGEGLLMGAQGLEQAICVEGQEIRNDIGGFGGNTAKVLEKDAHEIKRSLEKGVDSLIGAHTPQLYPQGRNYASQPLRSSSPSAESKINMLHQQKQIDFPNPLGLPSRPEESHPQKQRSLVNPPRPRTPSAEPQAFAHPQKHMNLPNPTQPPLPSPNSQVQHPHSRDHTNSPGSFRPNTHSAAPKMEKNPQIQKNSSNPLTFNASHPDLQRQPSAQGPPMPKPPAMSNKQLPSSPPSSIGLAGNSRPVSNTTAQASRPVPPSVIDSQHPPFSSSPTDGTRNQQANNTRIPPPQPSQKPATPPQREQFPGPSANNAISQLATDSQYPPAQPPLPSQGPAPRNQQVPFSTLSPSGGTIVQPRNSDNPPPHRPLSPLPGPGSRLQQHLSPIPSTHGPIIQPSNKSHLPPSSALSPLPVQLPKPLDNQLQAGQTSFGAPSPRLHTTEIDPEASQTPQAGPPSHESVVPSQTPMRRFSQPFGNQSENLSNNSLQPSSSDLHLKPSGQSTSNTHAYSTQHDSSAPSLSIESITPQSIAPTEPSPTTARHPLASAFEHLITGFKQRSEAGIAASNGHPGFFDSK